MHEINFFNFTHTKQEEEFKYLLYTHYVRTRPALVLEESDLFLLANTPTSSSTFWGVKLTIALTYRKPSHFFRECVKNGELPKFFPELYACINCLQDPLYHKDDVFDHTMMALDSAEEVGIFDLNTKLAILFHDIGKAYTRKEMPIE
jgi:hypothetical protein